MADEFTLLLVRLDNLVYNRISAAPKIRAGRTISRITPLAPAQRVEEIARMLRDAIAQTRYLSRGLAPLGSDRGGLRVVGDDERWLKPLPVVAAAPMADTV